MSVTDGTELPSYHEIEEIVADESIAFDTRRALMLDYLDYMEEEEENVTAYGFRDESHFEEFKERYMQSETMKISKGDLFWEDTSEGDIEDAYKTAKEAFDRNRDADRDNDREAVNKGDGALQEIAGKTSRTDPGTENSNTILDTGTPALKVFDVFLPRYEHAMAILGGGAVVSKEEIYRLYDEQRDIPFGKFKVAAEEFTATKKAVADSATDVRGELKSRLSGWEGAAAEQARAYQSGYNAGTDTVEEIFSNSAEAVLEAVAQVSEHCQGKAKWVQTYYFDRLFNKVTAQDLDRIMRIVEMGMNASQNDFRHCARLIGGEAEERVNDDSCDMNEETVTFVQQAARNWLADPFCQWFGQHIDNFKTMCENTRTAVDQTWSTLAKFLNDLPEDPYAPKPEGKPGTSSGNEGGVRPGGSGMPGGGSGGVPGGAGTPAMDLPKPESEALPGMNPVTGKPLELDPETGKPYPIDAETGEAVKTTGDDQDVMTVKKGENEISLSEPDKGGKMGITVDNGKGEPKEYQLDFGDDKEAGTEGHGKKPGEFGPDGTPSGAPGDKVYQPGPDGQIVIKDGDLTITAERPDGPEGPVVVTVDDGKGESTTYTLGEADEPKSSPSTGGGESKFGQSGELPKTASSDGGASGATQPQFVSGFGDAVSGALGDGPGSGGAGVASGGVGLGDTNSLDAGQQVGAGQPFAAAPSAGLASAPMGGPGDGGSAQAAGGAPMGGIMGGMGAGAGGGGEDQAHSRSYRIDGGLFDTEDSVAAGVADRISGFLSDDE